MYEETCIAITNYIRCYCLNNLAKDGLPDPNGPLSLRVPSDEGVGQPTKGIRGIVE